MFSIVIPVYNRPQLLRRAINSVISQSSKRWEIVVVDDGSTLDIEPVLSSFENDDIRYIRVPRMGASVARNVGIAMAKFDWIAFLDSDDWWPENKLEVFQNYISDHPVVDVLCSGLTYFDEKAGQFGRTFEVRISSGFERELLTHNTLKALSNVVVRRGALFAVNGFDITLPARQDIDLYVRLAEKFVFDSINEPLCFMSVKTDDKISVNPEKRYKGLLLFYQKHRKKMDISQRLHSSKRILYYSIKCRDWANVMRYLLPSIGSIAFSWMRSK